MRTKGHSKPHCVRMEPHYLRTWSRVGLREQDCDYRSRMTTKTVSYFAAGDTIVGFTPSCIFHLTAIIPNDSTPWQGQQKGILLPQPKSTQITYFCPYSRWWQGSGRRITWITVIWVVAG